MGCVTFPSQTFDCEPKDSSDGASERPPWELMGAAEP